MLGWVSPFSLRRAGAPIVTRRAGGGGGAVLRPRLTWLLGVAETCRKRHLKDGQKPSRSYFVIFFARVKIVASRGKN